MYKNITTDELKSLIGRINIIDVRDNYLFNLGNIPTSRNIPMNYILLEPNKYLNQNDIYYIYCTQGMQSSKVCYSLTLKGYKVINVLGGYNDYINR